jgi:hypothetical protein
LAPSRTKPILIKLTAAEHATLSTAAGARGLGLGPWLRALGLAVASSGREQILFSPSTERARAYGGLGGTRRPAGDRTSRRPGAAQKATQTPRSRN